MAGLYGRFSWVSTGRYRFFVLENGNARNSASACAIPKSIKDLRLFARQAGAWSPRPDPADGTVEIGEPEQTEDGDDDRLAQGGNAVGKIGDATTEQCGFG